MDELKALRQYFAGLKALLLQAEGVPAAFAQAIIGHSTQTVAYDTYGSGVPVATLATVLKGVWSPDGAFATGAL
jgi:hypothetical protein